MDTRGRNPRPIAFLSRISVRLLAFNLLGDGLRDILDPQSRG